MPYTDEACNKLSTELRECLEEHNVTENVAKWLAEQNITKIEAFADLAESKKEIIDAVGRPAGIEVGDPIKCQPLKTAWRYAEARAKATLDAEMSGKEPEVAFCMTAEQRQKLDATVEAKFKFRWPANLTPASGIIAKLENVYRKKLQETPKVTEARSILDKGTQAMKVTLSFHEGQQSVMGRTTTDNEPDVNNMWAFRCKHMTLMIAYVQAGGPEFTWADMATMLDYHEWVMEKITKRPRPLLEAVIEADYKMRAEWMLAYTTGTHSSITEALKHHRSESNHLFANLPTYTGGQEGGKRARHEPPPPLPPRSPTAAATSGSPKGEAKAQAKATRSASSTTRRRAAGRGPSAHSSTHASCQGARTIGQNTPTTEMAPRGRPARGIASAGIVTTGLNHWPTSLLE